MIASRCMGQANTLLALSPNGSSDNDPEVDADGDGEGEADTYGDVENEEENDDNEDPFDEQDQDDSQDPSGDTPNQGQLKHPPTSNASSSNAATSTQNRGHPPPSTPTSALNPTVLLTSPSPARTPSATIGLGIQPFRTRPEALTASVYEIVPTIAAPHSTSINSITATPDLRWVFSGGADGYIRKFNWIDTVNGKSMLTVAQRHPFVDSVTKAGVLMSYWENEDSQSKHYSRSGRLFSLILTITKPKQRWPRRALISHRCIHWQSSVTVYGCCPVSRMVASICNPFVMMKGNKSHVCDSIHRQYRFLI